MGLLQYLRSDSGARVRALSTRPPAGRPTRLRGCERCQSCNYPLLFIGSDGRGGTQLLHDRGEIEPHVLAPDQTIGRHVEHVQQAKAQAPATAGIPNDVRGSVPSHGLSSTTKSGP